MPRPSRESRCELAESSWKTANRILPNPIFAKAADSAGSSHHRLAGRVSRQRWWAPRGIIDAVWPADREEIRWDPDAGRDLGSEFSFELLGRRNGRTLSEISVFLTVLFRRAIAELTQKRVLADGGSTQRSSNQRSKKDPISDGSSGSNHRVSAVRDNASGSGQTLLMDEPALRASQYTSTRSLVNSDSQHKASALISLGRLER
ncbi:hypothetical protein ACVW1A_000335 [Bradyrhizobium sp. LB1.3]